MREDTQERGGDGSGRCAAYVAAGDQRFRDEAIWSLTTLRRFMPELPAVLFTDDADPASRAAFDEIVLVENSFAQFKVGTPPWTHPGFLTRVDAFLAAVERGDYDRVLLLDSDVEFTGDISGVFQTLDRFDIAIAHAPYRHNEVSADIPEAFVEFNVGLIAVRNSPASLAMLRACGALYLAQSDWWHNDQVAFRRAVWEANVRVATLPPEFNFRPSRFAKKSVPRVLHGFARSYASEKPGHRIRLFTTDCGQSQPTLGREFAMRALGLLTHPGGVLLDPMVDNTFGWDLKRYAGWLPQREPWVGIVHNPPDAPAGASPEIYCASDAFRRSLPNCLGLFTFSEHLAQWLRRLGVPVEVVPHPTDLRVPAFSPAAYRRSEPRVVLQIGSWLQRPESFRRLSSPGHAKRFLPVPGDSADDVEAAAWPAVEIVPFKTQYQYDAILQGSVVFADVVDAGAHPVLLDCIARGTPIVVNRHPAIVEYVGADYPLLYDTLEEASVLLASEEALLAGHRHLADPALRNRYSGKAFVAAILGSRTYRGLPAVG